MKIWIDADACPRVIRDIIYKASSRLKVPVLLVANSPIHTPNVALVRSIVVSKGEDKADTYIAERVEGVDLVITADIPLAARVVERGAAAINPRGEVYTEANVRERLSVRDFMHDLRESGVQHGGPSKLGAKEKQRFANALDRELTRRVRMRS